MVTAIDTSKHDMIFDPAPLNIAARSVAVIGCGAVGSMVALHLAKLGIERIMLIDDDIIEPHNIANQLIYGIGDIGSHKCEVLRQKLQHLTVGRLYRTRCERLGPNPHTRLPYDYVFCCVDSMSARKTILEEHVLLNGKTKFFADTRMNARNWLAYGFDPQKSAHVNQYQNELYPDEDVAPQHIGTCRITPSIAATAGVVASAVIWQFIEHVAGRAYSNEICGQITPVWSTTVSRNFEA